MDLNVGGDFDERHGDRRAECQGGPEGRAWGRAIWGVGSILQRYIVWVTRTASHPSPAIQRDFCSKQGTSGREPIVDKADINRSS